MARWEVIKGDKSTKYKTNVFNHDKYFLYLNTILTVFIFLKIYKFF